MTVQKSITLDVNGREREAVVPANATLLETLRDLGCFEVKSGCEKGDCGACAVLIDGEAVDSCLTLTWTVQGRCVTTVAGLLARDGGRHPLVDAFIARGAVQCGYCTPGLIVAAASMLHDNPAPDEDDMRLGLSGNLCRCTGYTKVFDAIRDAAAVLDEERGR
jgi:carbon-monoxide dehydrogenase small subunit